MARGVSRGDRRRGDCREIMSGRDLGSHSMARREMLVFQSERHKKLLEASTRVAPTDAALEAHCCAESARCLRERGPAKQLLQQVREETTPALTGVVADGRGGRGWPQWVETTRLGA